MFLFLLRMCVPALWGLCQWLCHISWHNNKEEIESTLSVLSYQCVSFIDVAYIIFHKHFCLLIIKACIIFHFIRPNKPCQNRILYIWTVLVQRSVRISARDWPESTIFFKNRRLFTTWAVWKEYKRSSLPVCEPPI